MYEPREASPEIMIYRIIGASERWWPDANGNWHDGEGPMAGASCAGFDGFGDLPLPQQCHPRARFWFTQAGWEKYGREVLKSATQSGRTFRLLVQKNPPRSAVVYRDKWQVALLPVKQRKGEHDKDRQG